MSHEININKIFQEYWNNNKCYSFGTNPNTEEFIRFSSRLIVLMRNISTDI